MTTPMPKEKRPAMQKLSRNVSVAPGRNVVHEPPTGLTAEINESPRVVMQRNTLANVFAGGANPGAKLLPAPLMRGIAGLSGMNLDDVRVFENSAKPADVGASATAQGDEIHLAPGQNAHLPHEAWHIVQQRQGRVHTTLREQGVEINDEPHLEREATVMGNRAMQAQESALPIEPAPGPMQCARGPLQKKDPEDEEPDNEEEESLHLSEWEEGDFVRPSTSPRNAVEEDVDSSDKLTNFQAGTEIGNDALGVANKSETVVGHGGTILGGALGVYSNAKSLPQSVQDTADNTKQTTDRVQTGAETTNSLANIASGGATITQQLPFLSSAVTSGASTMGTVLGPVTGGLQTGIGAYGAVKHHSRLNRVQTAHGELDAFGTGDELERAQEELADREHDLMLLKINWDKRCDQFDEAIEKHRAAGRQKKVNGLTQRKRVEELRYEKVLEALHNRIETLEDKLGDLPQSHERTKSTLLTLSNRLTLKRNSSMGDVIGGGTGLVGGGLALTVASGPFAPITALGVGLVGVSLLIYKYRAKQASKEQLVDEWLGIDPKLEPKAKEAARKQAFAARNYASLDVAYNKMMDEMAEHMHNVLVNSNASEKEKQAMAVAAEGLGFNLKQGIPDAEKIASAMKE